jgi:crotonobetainyl-CoA:carnitine CoA-transferase CaiB-like acyl-CoA transferase
LSIEHSSAVIRANPRPVHIDDILMPVMEPTTGRGSPPGGPLAGLTVVDLTRVLSGPYCTMQLADMGARVIKIERPGQGDDTRGWGPPFVQGESAYFMSINRNKESVTLDFKHPDGRMLLDRLIARADIVVENFRPGTLDSVGFDYASLEARYPRLIYASISGFGQNGPQRDRPGYDAVVQGEGGLMSITGAPDGPGYRLGVAIGDLVSGLYAAQGILLALAARERTGRGQYVDVGMLDSVASLLTYQAGIYFATGVPSGRMGNRHPSIVPYEVFETRDGDIVLAVGNDELWRRFCRVAGLEQLAQDGRFATNRDRVLNYEVLRPLIAGKFAGRSRADWLTALGAAGIPAGAVRDVGEVLTDEQLIARCMVESVEHPTTGVVRVLGVPVKLSSTPGAIYRPPPRLGEHTGPVLEELGLDPTRIDQLRQAGVI